MTASITEAVPASSPALILASSGRTLTFGQLEDRSRRLAALLRRSGLGRGSNLAVLLQNCPEYLEVCWAAQRSGLLYTPVNWHLGPEEAGYIVSDCEATAIIASAGLSDLLTALEPQLSAVRTKLAVGGPVAGFADYEASVQASEPDPTLVEQEGSFMFYSSGTTGRPKGIKPVHLERPFGSVGSFDMLVRSVYGFEPGIVYLCPAPLYHAAPIGWSMAAQRAGGTVVLMERFDPLETLAAIERYRVTHAQFVPTHFIRMLKLSPEERGRFDLSSLRTVVHAAAPCPVEVKRQMIEWLGPVVYEYYSGSEGMGFCAVGPAEWLAHPGTVGRALTGTPHITDEGGRELPPGQVGQIWFETATRFEYHNDPQKTGEVFNDRGWGTLGDVGYLDDEGYLYLTDRVSHMIISGGVNIYPQEIEDALVVHPAVADAAVIGIAHPEMGEAVLAVIQPADAEADRAELERELRVYCRDRLAGFKRPHQYRFMTDLPRLPTGKLLKRKLREEFGGSSAASVAAGR